MMQTSNKRQLGFSLVEMAVVVVVVGLIGALVWLMLPQTRDTLLDRASEQRLAAADQAVTGYVFAHGRLPCPDLTGNGEQAPNCTSTSVGLLPVVTLGLADGGWLSDGPPRYAVNPLAGIAQNSSGPALFLPDVPDSVSSSDEPVLGFCLKLREAAGQGGGLVMPAPAGSTSLAYVLVDGGREDADGSGSLFDGVGGALPRPDAPASTLSDDRSHAVGLGQLAARLDCARWLARANARGLDVVAAADVQRVAEAFVVFRDFGVDVRTFDRDYAIAQELLAIADLAISVAIGASAIAISVVPLGGQSAIASIGAATLAIGAATANVVASSVTLGLAVGALDEARSQRDQAQDHLDAMRALYQQSLERARDEVAKGVLR